MFSLRIVNADFYTAPPIPGLDPIYSNFRESKVTRVPLIRIFGATRNGQKTCLHLHGVFPYIYVPYDGSQPTDKYLKQFATCVDFAVHVSQGKASSSTHHVYDVCLVKGRPFYGYHENEQDFIKISLYNPFIVTRVVDLLRSGAIMNRVFEPQEAHIPYLLQMFMDYNLYGMNFLNTSAVKFRSPIRLLSEDQCSRSLNLSPMVHDGSPTSPSSLIGSVSSPAAANQYWSEETVPSEWILGSEVERVSVCELEVDIRAQDILNQQEIKANVGSNPGLAAIWEDERQRRKFHNDDAVLASPATQDRGVLPDLEAERHYKAKIRQFLEEQDLFLMTQTRETSLDNISPGDVPAAQLMSKELTEHMEEDDDSAEPLVNTSIVQEVVEESQRSLSQRLGSSFDMKMVEMLASLAEDDDPVQSQQLQASVASILDDEEYPDEDQSPEEKEVAHAQEEEESILMSQQVWDDTDPQWHRSGGVEERKEDSHQEVSSSFRISQYNIEGLEDTWTGSLLTEENIPQVDGANDDDEDVAMSSSSTSSYRKSLHRKTRASQSSPRHKTSHLHVTRKEGPANEPMRRLGMSRVRIRSSQGNSRTLTSGSDTTERLGISKHASGSSINLADHPKDQQSTESKSNAKCTDPNFDDLRDFNSGDEKSFRLRLSETSSSEEMSEKDTVSVVSPVKKHPRKNTDRQTTRPKNLSRTKKCEGIRDSVQGKATTVRQEFPRLGKQQNESSFKRLRSLVFGASSHQETKPEKRKTKSREYQTRKKPRKMNVVLENIITEDSHDFATKIVTRKETSRGKATSNSNTVFLRGKTSTAGASATESKVPRDSKLNKCSLVKNRTSVQNTAPSVSPHLVKLSESAITLVQKKRSQKLCLLLQDASLAERLNDRYSEALARYRKRLHKSRTNVSTNRSPVDQLPSSSSSGLNYTDDRKELESSTRTSSPATQIKSTKSLSSRRLPLKTSRRVQPEGSLTEGPSPEKVFCQRISTPPSTPRNKIQGNMPCSQRASPRSSPSSRSSPLSQKRVRSSPRKTDKKSGRYGVLDVTVQKSPPKTPTQGCTHSAPVTESNVIINTNAAKSAPSSEIKEKVSPETPSQRFDRSQSSTQSCKINLVSGKVTFSSSALRDCNKQEGDSNVTDENDVKIESQHNDAIHLDDDRAVTCIPSSPLGPVSVSMETDMVDNQRPMNNTRENEEENLFLRNKEKALETGWSQSNVRASGFLGTDNGNDHPYENALFNMSYVSPKTESEMSYSPPKPLSPSVAEVRSFENAEEIVPGNEESATKALVSDHLKFGVENSESRTLQHPAKDSTFDKCSEKSDLGAHENKRSKNPCVQAVRQKSEENKKSKSSVVRFIQFSEFEHSESSQEETPDGLLLAVGETQSDTEEAIHHVDDDADAFGDKTSAGDQQNELFNQPILDPSQLVSGRENSNSHGSASSITGLHSLVPSQNEGNNEDTKVENVALTPSLECHEDIVLTSRALLESEDSRTGQNRIASSRAKLNISESSSEDVFPLSKSPALSREIEFINVNESTDVDEEESCYSRKESENVFPEKEVSESIEGKSDQICSSADVNRSSDEEGTDETHGGQNTNNCPSTPHSSDESSRSKKSSSRSMYSPYSSQDISRSPSILEDYVSGANCVTDRYKSPAFKATSLALDASNDRFASVAMTPLRPAPLAFELMKTTKDLGIPGARHQPPFFSNPDDIPEIPSETGVRLLRIQSKQASSLPEFESFSFLVGLRQWRALVYNDHESSFQEACRQNLGPTSTFAAGIDKNPQLALALMGDHSVVLTPCKTAPLAKDVRTWARRRAARQKAKTERLDKNEGQGRRQLGIDYDKGNACPLDKSPGHVQGNVTDSDAKNSSAKTASSSKLLARGVSSTEKRIPSPRSVDKEDSVTTQAIDRTLEEDTPMRSESSKDLSSSFTPLSPDERNIDFRNLEINNPIATEIKTPVQEQPGKIRFPSEDAVFKPPLSRYKLNFTNVTQKQGSCSRSPSTFPRQPASPQTAPYHSTPIACKRPVRPQSPVLTPIAGTSTEGRGTSAKMSGAMEKIPSGNLRGQSQPPSQIKMLTPEMRVRRQLEAGSQIEGPSPANTCGFRIPQMDIQGAKATHEVQHVTLLSIELHARTRRNLRPDPEFDPICAIFYHVQTDTPGPSNAVTGVICVDKESAVSAEESRAMSYTKHEGSYAVTQQSSTSQAPSLSTCTSSSVTHRRKRPLLERSGVSRCRTSYVKEEKDLFPALISLVHIWDPDILIGYEVQMLSWGYLIQRALVFELDLAAKLARVSGTSSSSNIDAEKDQWGAAHASELKIAGRIILNVWRLMRHEVTLNIYTFENVAFHVLHERIPLFSFRTLSDWWDHKTDMHRWRTVQHYVTHCHGNVRILEQLDFIGRTSELARLFGILFYSVISRGSQYRVESMMLRIAKPMNYIAASPSVQQRNSMRAPEVIPLVMEPESRFYHDPVLVLDFQSLYPSMMIAYNYCFSTCLGRVSYITEGERFKFGALTLSVPTILLKLHENDIHVSPNGVAFLKSHVRRGVLPRMVESILNTRIMVKNSMKKWKNEKSTYRMLDARQLGLKLIANVTYGYTSAHFSGRMPCVEIGDSIVRKARETLERAIELVNSTPKWGARVVYGDTDSLFVLLKGVTKDEAFRIGHEITAAVTAMNPKPVKLKFEKVYLPCVLQTKKRYVGYMYETVDQKDPVFDAKGIETVRRDSCPAVAKVLEKSLRILFESRDVSLVKKFVQRQCLKVMEARVSLTDLTFAKEYRGMRSYKPGACVPALELARRMLKEDRRSEPRVSERVPFVVVYGSPGLPLIQLIRR